VTLLTLAIPTTASARTGSLTYTEPVTACGSHRTVLARNVPNGAHYLVIYQVDCLDPAIQTVNFRTWH
jgi:hypothetical protein